MKAVKKSSMTLLCLSLATACLWGIFTIMVASSANANRGNDRSGEIKTAQTIVISPTVLETALDPDQQVSQGLWLINPGNSPISFTIYEENTGIPEAGFYLLPRSQSVVDPVIQSILSVQESTQVIIFLREQPDLSPAYQITNKDRRVEYVNNRLLETADHSRKLFDWLESRGTRPHRLLLANAITAWVNLQQLDTLSKDPLVRIISPNQERYLPTTESTHLLVAQGPIAPAFQIDTTGWNISKIRADEAWSAFGITGEGAVVGIVDTGVKFDHPALVNSYRGNLGGGSFEHNYNWFDFVDGTQYPIDPNGHGTMGAGIVSGDDGAANQIGVAPGADWIAVRACDGGACSDADLIAALEWMLAPTRLDGTNPDPSMAPDIVLGMWGGVGCDYTFQFSLMALRAANILPVFSPGGMGPGCMTVGSPAALSEAFSAGATDVNDLIAPFSARGPSPCTGEIKPEVSAPGVDITTANNTGGYVSTSGTSWSAAHAAGAAAMVFSANPLLGINQVEEYLQNTAVCIEDLSCGGQPCPGANNVYGHGRIDVFEAVYAALSDLPVTDQIPWLSQDPIRGTVPAADSVIIQVIFSAAGLDPGSYAGKLEILTHDGSAGILQVPVTLTVTVPCRPITDVSISFVPTSPHQGEVITFTASATGTLPISYTWLFDDATSMSGPEVTHIFSNPGVHVAELTVENGCGAPVNVEVDVLITQLSWLPLIGN